MQHWTMCLTLTLLSLGCGENVKDDSDVGAGGMGGMPMTDRGIGTDMIIRDSGLIADTGGGGMGGMPPMETPILERCPDAQSGTYMLVLFPDRVDAYRQPNNTYTARYECKFLALDENGITEATGMAIGEDGTIFIVQPEDDRGVVYTFNTDGAFERRVESNINLAGVGGIWKTFGDDFLVWSRANQNLYKLSNEGRFRGTFSPPVWQGSRVPNITDIAFLSQESIVMTFSDRPAQIFLRPDSPSWSDDEIGPGNAVSAVETDEGTKIMMTGQIGGEGNGYGVALYKPINTGREAAIIRELLLVPASQIVDGKDLLVVSNGLFVLDSALGGAAKITSFNASGEAQEEIMLPGGGSPLSFTKARIFPSF